VGETPMTRLPREPMQDRWHWVRNDGGDWFPAVCEVGAAGGWTNQDTWEDWDGNVTEWKLISLPGPYG
jgi:hypothetical protein